MYDSRIPVFFVQINSMDHNIINLSRPVDDGPGGTYGSVAQSVRAAGFTVVKEELENDWVALLCKSL